MPKKSFFGKIGNIFKAIFSFLSPKKGTEVIPPVIKPVPVPDPQPEPPVVIDPVPEPQPDIPVEVVPEPLPDPVLEAPEEEVPIIPLPVPEPEPEPEPEPQPLPPAAEVPPVKEQEPVKPPVKQYLKNVLPFRFGAAVKHGITKPGGYHDLLPELKDATCENEMKMGVHKSFGVFDFKKADEMVSLFKSYGLRIHGHALVYGHAKWMETYKGDFDQLMKVHINGVMKHFKGKVDSWDVVNEAWKDGGKMDENLWYKKIGADYVIKAFRYAREADPTAKLFYNDFSIHFTNSKTNKVMEFAKQALKEGVIDGIGHQMHTDINMDMGEWKRNLKKWVDLGLLIHISEMEVSVKSNVITPALAERQSQTYQKVFDILTSATPAKQIWGVKTWGLGNGDWFENAGEPRDKWKDVPLLFDEWNKRTKAYDDLLKKYSS